MPEIKHPQAAPPLSPAPQKPSTPQEEAPPISQVASTEAKDRLDILEAGKDPTDAKKASETIADKQEKEYETELEDLIARILARQKVEKEHASEMKEPDWTKVTERDALNLRNPIYIPAIEHDIPEYLTVKLQDQEYEAVWVNRDQRRVSYFSAQGYEFVKPQHLKRGWNPPLKFDSENNLVFEDVIAMRVHKRILFGKRRKALEISQLQLRGAKSTIAKKLKKDTSEGDDLLGYSADPLLDLNFKRDRLSFYDPD